MLKVFVTLIVCALVVTAAWLIAGLPGHVTVSLAGYTIETSTALAAVALLIIVLVLFAVLRLIGGIFRLPWRIGAWRGRKRRESGDTAVTRTLVALAAGDQGDARREARRARRLLGDTPQTLLLAAEAGRLAGNDGEAAEIYKSLAVRADAAFLGLRGLFRQAIAREDWSGAAALARRAEDVHPGGAWLREERARLAVRTGDWGQALKLAAPGAPMVTYATAAAETERDPSEAMRLAKQAWKDDPGFTPAAVAYAARLRAAGRESRAQSVIRTAWRARPHPDLAEFALAPIKDPLARVKEGGKLTAANPDDPESRLLLARLCLAADLTGEARRHIEAARRAGMNQKRLWMLLADLEAEERGDTEAGRLAQRDALRHAAMAEPDPTWRCEACGTEQAKWRPACPVCHTAGRIRWGTPRLALPAP
jgi:HemY protein